MFVQTYNPDSVFIRQIEYSFGIKNDCPWHERVLIIFHSGKIIEHVAGEKVYLGLVQADSAGKYYHREVKDKFREKRIK